MKKPDRKDLAELQRHIRDYPVLSRLYGDAGAFARAAMLEYVAKNQRSTGEGLEVDMERQAQELGYRTSRPLERLLVENIVMCRLALYEVQRRYAGMVADPETSIAQADQREKRPTRTQTRYLKACDQPARTRKTLRPMRVNVGVNQLNVPGAVKGNEWLAAGPTSSKEKDLL